MYLHVAHFQKFLFTSLYVYQYVGDMWTVNSQMVCLCNSLVYIVHVYSQTLCTYNVCVCTCRNSNRHIHKQIQKLNETSKAIESCDTALKLVPRHIKALYKR
jgi:hypothetical protein